MRRADNEQQELESQVRNAFHYGHNIAFWDTIFSSNIQQLCYVYEELIAKVFTVECLKVTKTNINVLKDLYDPKNKMFCTVCEITTRTNFKYLFPIYKLPAGVRANMIIGKLDEFYKDKLILEDIQPKIKLNAFEYYFFSLAHLTVSQPFIKLDDKYLFLEFLNILEEYIKYFLHSPRSKKLSNSQHYISKLNTSWVIKTFLKIMVEFWLKQIPTYELALYIDKTESYPQLEQFFTKCDFELLAATNISRYLTMLIKYMHAFSMHLPLNNNKMDVRESNDIVMLRKGLMGDYVACLLYSYLRFMILNFPNNLENHYSIWITFVKPWRYANHFKTSSKYNNTNSFNDDASYVDKEQDFMQWTDFIDKYLPFYTTLLQYILDTISPVHLQNSLPFLLKLSKNFASRDFMKKAIFNALNNKITLIGNNSSRITDNWYNNFCNLQESHNLELEHLFMPNQKNKILKWLQMFAEKIKDINLRTKPSRKWLERFFYSDETKSLSEHVAQLKEIFLIWSNFFEVDTKNMLAEEGDNFFNDDETDDGHLPPYIQKKIDEGKFQYDVCVMQNPDEMDIRISEIGPLARFLYQLSEYLNGQYRYAIIQSVKEPGLRGQISRYLFRPPPISILHRSPITAARPKNDVRRLHPSMRNFARRNNENYRVSLRFIASVFFLIKLAVIGVLFIWYFDASFQTFLVVIFFVVASFCVLIRNVILRLYL